MGLTSSPTYAKFVIWRLGRRVVLMSDTSILKFQRGLEIKLCMELNIENIEPSNTFYICPNHGLPSWTAWLISGTRQWRPNLHALCPGWTSGAAVPADNSVIHCMRTGQKTKKERVSSRLYDDGATRMH